MNQSTKQTMKRVIRIGSRPFIVSLLGCIITAVLNLSLFILTNAIISEITNQALANDYHISKILVIGILLILIVPFYFLGLQLNVRGGLYASNRFKGELISKSLHHHEAIIKEGQTSSIMAVFTNDGSTVDDFYFQGLNWRIVQPIVQGIFAIVLLVYQNYLIALLCIAIGLLSVYVSSKDSRKIQDIDQSSRRLFQIHTNTLSSIIANDDVIRLLNIQDGMVEHYKKEHEDFSEAIIQAESLKEKINTWNSLFTVLSRSMLLAIGVYLFAKGTMSFGVIFILIPLQSSVSSMFSSLVSSRNYIAEVSNAAQRAFEVMDARSETLNDTLPELTLTQPSPHIEYACIDFAYEPTHPLFQHFNLKLDAGSTTAFVGESGSGKSTLFQLLLGLYDVEAGAIKIDDINIETVNKMSLRDHMVYIEQSAALFSRTIYENIAIGGGYDIEKVPYEAVIEAAKKAYIHDVIMALPEQYDTVLKDQGSMLSGGQKQRIAIARAFMSKAPILIMDEPTSALDNESEKKVQLALDALKGNKTVLIAAHRLSTIKDADHIVVLQQGALIEEGTHNQLIQAQGYYASLYRSGTLGGQDA